VEKSIYRYILRYSKPQQVVLTLMAVASFPFLYAFYELPKMIINGAIQAVNIDFPVEFVSLEFGQLDYLYLLSGVFLLLVVINQCFKYIINVYRGVSGERLLRRFRFDLYSRVLRARPETS
jgi:putative ABC transport system ATP-binding protein